MLILIAALAAQPALICTHERTGERRPASIVRLGGRDRIAVEAR